MEARTEKKVRRTIGAKIKELRKKKNLNVDEVGEYLKKSGKTISAWEVGRGEPDGDELIALCRLFDARISEFYGEPTTPADFRPVPLFGAVAGGMPIEMIEDKELKEAPARFLDDDPDCFLVKIKGNSENRRHIHDGDFALISPKYKEPTKDDLFLVAVNGDEATLKQVEILDNGIELIPDSYDPTYTRQVYDFNDPDTPPVRILGKYVWHCAPF